MRGLEGTTHNLFDLYTIFHIIICIKKKKKDPGGLNIRVKV